MSERDYYEILGVTKNTDAKAIKPLTSSKSASTTSASSAPALAASVKPSPPVSAPAFACAFSAKGWAISQKHHPDRNKDNKEAAEKTFKEIQKAYSILSDEQKRQAYDQFGHAGVNGNAGGGGFGGGNPFGGGGGFGDIFGDIFGGGRQAQPDGQGCCTEKGPCCICTCPAPRQVPQVLAPSNWRR
jgi:molecular chaperone DnaJ